MCNNTEGKGLQKEAMCNNTSKGFAANVCFLPQVTRGATRCNMLQHAATRCNTLKHTATHCSTLQHTETRCNTLQHTATHCNALQRTATHCNTLQHALRCTSRHMHVTCMHELWHMRT